MSYQLVSKEDFDKFISNYPSQLNVNVCGISEPLLVTYNDFSLKKKWPESVVAKYHDTECYPKNGKYPFIWEEREYYIKEKQ